MNATVVWFRQDLRLQDNPALHAAVTRGGPVIPVYVVDDAAEGRWTAGPASSWWRNESLKALDASLRDRGSRLTLARGDTRVVLRDVGRKAGADAIYFNRRYEPHAVAQESWLETAWRDDGLQVKHFNAALLHEPASIQNRQKRPFQVFSAYWRECLAADVVAPLKLPEGRLPAPANWPASLDIAAAGLLPPRAGSTVLAEHWKPGETGAAERLRRFVSDHLDRYDIDREEPAVDGTSRLSPHLHFGEVGPRQLWAAVRARGRGSGVFPPNKGAAAFLRELGWREFAYHLLFHFPQTPVYPLRGDFARFRWAEDTGQRKLRAWQRGETGYPIVDAGMRQLAQTGWMHNRARMVAASFLVKHLRLPWTAGAAWFWGTLVDADLANNTLGWQWTAGCGADAAPYFRIFAPVLQGRKFDRAGVYVRRWVPELAALPDQYLHAPWEAPPSALQTAGVRLGETYPRPMVDHVAAREAALAAFHELRATGPGSEF